MLPSRFEVLNGTHRVVGDVFSNVVEDLGTVEPVRRGQDGELPGLAVDYRPLQALLVLRVELRKPVGEKRHVFAWLESFLFLLVGILAELRALFSV